MLLGGYFYNLEVMIFSLVSIVSHFSDFLQPTCITLLKTGKTSLKNSSSDSAVSPLPMREAQAYR